MSSRLVSVEKGMEVAMDLVNKAQSLKGNRLGGDVILTEGDAMIIEMLGMVVGMMANLCLILEEER